MDDSIAGSAVCFAGGRPREGRSFKSRDEWVALQPAQQDKAFTSLLKVWAHSFSPSTMVR